MGFGAFRLILVSLLFLNISHGFVTSGFYAISLLMLTFFIYRIFMSITFFSLPEF